MEYIRLGNTGLDVSKICFGSLTIGPLQSNLPLDDGVLVICEALNQGINFIDTAEIYGTYNYIKNAIKKSSKKPIIATKSYAYDKNTAGISLEKARKEMDLDCIDVFLLHEQESSYTFKGHWEALEFFINAKLQGKIKAFGISTHHIRAVEDSLNIDEIEVLHPILNEAGLGICDGTSTQMIAALQKAYSNGKGIYSMKPLGGGNLISSYTSAMSFVRSLDCVHSVAIGMQSVEEVLMNVSFFNGQKISDEVLEKVKSKERRLHIESYCEGCGKCIEKCNQKALTLGSVGDDKNRVFVSKDKCTLCGYCSRACPIFAIKIC